MEGKSRDNNRAATKRRKEDIRGADGQQTDGDQIPVGTVSPSASRQRLADIDNVHDSILFSIIIVPLGGK